MPTLPALPNPTAELVAAETVAQLVSDWHAALDRRVAAGELSPNTRTTYTIGAQKFVDWATAHAPEGVTADTLRDWIAELRQAGRKPGAINAWLNGVRHFFAWAVESRRTLFNPAENVRGATRRGTSKRHKRGMLAPDEVRRLLASVDTTTAEGKRDSAVLNLMLYTGVRGVEVARATYDDLHINGVMRLAVQGKGHAEADDVVMIDHPRAKDAVRDWLAVRGEGAGALFGSLSNRSRGGHLSLSYLRRMIAGHLKAAGIKRKDITTHSLRHTAASTALRNGASLVQVQSMLRHSSATSTAIYLHELSRDTNPAEAFINYDD